MNYLQNLNLDVYAIIIEKITPCDLQYLRSTCHKIRDVLDQKAIPRLHKSLERMHGKLLEELNREVKICQIKEDAINLDVKKELEELEREAKAEDIKSGEYDEERDGDYEFVMYDDNTMGEEIYGKFSYLKGLRNLNYKINILGHSFDFLLEELIKIKVKIETCTIDLHPPQQFSSVTENTVKRFNKKTHKKNVNYKNNANIPEINLCDTCKMDCSTIPHFRLVDHWSKYSYCYYCVVNNSIESLLKRKFISNLLRPSTSSTLQMLAVNYNALRIMSGLGSLAYSN